jgi:1,3-beta-glucan synthase
MPPAFPQPQQDPFNSYDPQPANPVMQHQYTPYQDNEAEMNARYAGGGMAAETYASESNFSDYSEFSSGQHVADPC